MGVKSVLVVRCGALGDLVYATSVIDALKLEFGEDTIIDFVCTPGSGTLFKNDPRVRKVFPLKHKKIPILFSQDKKRVIQVSKEHPYDLLINFETGKQFKGLVTKIVSKQKIGAFFNTLHLIPCNNRAEGIKNYLLPVVSKENIELSVPKISIENVDSIKKKFMLHDRYIVIAPSNSHIKKKGINYRAWEQKSWKILADELSKHLQVVFVGAKGEEFFFEDFKPYNSNTISLVGQNSLSELSTIIAHANAVVCTDSAIGHISAAVNTPVFVLMGPNDPVMDSPYQTAHNKVHVISLHLPCSPCYKTDTMKRCKDNICMKQITPTMVFETISSAAIL